MANKFPLIEARVKVYNPIEEMWMEGQCVDHISTQWVLRWVGPARLRHDQVIHASWKWSYSDQAA